MNQEQFYSDFGAYAGIPSDVKITDIEQECSYSEGCPTCGGDYEFTMFVRGERSDGSRFYQTVNGKLTDFIQSLPKE